MRPCLPAWPWPTTACGFRYNETYMIPMRTFATDTINGGFSLSDYAGYDWRCRPGRRKEAQKAGRCCSNMTLRPVSAGANEPSGNTVAEWSNWPLPDDWGRAEFLVGKGNTVADWSN